MERVFIGIMALIVGVVIYMAVSYHIEFNSGYDEGVAAVRDDSVDIHRMKSGVDEDKAADMGYLKGVVEALLMKTELALE